MREKVSGTRLSVRAISGNHVVVLAWDLRDYDTTKLLGFAIERTEFDGANVRERYFLRGIKRFADKDKGMAAGQPVPTSEHPVQSFQWGDYTAKPSTTYEYRVVPATGEPKNLALDDANAVAVRVTTEPLHGTPHSVFFNRGAAGSQAYARQFPNPTPDTTHPDTPQMQWLSRGLFEALVAFVQRASGPGWALRGALYEFHYAPANEEFRKAKARGVDVQVLYDEPNYGKPNRAAIGRAKLTAVCAPRAAGGAQKHNKFVVLLHGGQPVAVWTGSTNLSDGGLFGHSNVGHQVDDPAVAARYLDYWTALCNATPGAAASKPLRDRRTDPGTAKLTGANGAATPTPPGRTPENSIVALFSPRDGATLKWYADRMAEARDLVCFTLAFGLAKVFEPYLAEDNAVLRYVLSDKALAQRELITRDKDVVYAAGAKFDKGDLPTFLAEKLAHTKGILYIHDKFLLVDPLGDDPTVITGSANFSPASQTSNDENMLVIRGDARVADIYFGEFMRLFDHFYSRYVVKKIKDEAKKAKAAKTGKKKPAAAKSSGGYLWPDASWVAAHFAEGPKSRRRQVFHGGW